MTHDAPVRQRLLEPAIDTIDVDQRDRILDEATLAVLTEPDSKRN